MIEDLEAVRELHEFVSRRLQERVRLAEEAEDEAARGFLVGSCEIVARMGEDIAARPWALGEVSNYLLRAAVRYRRHPEFQAWWGRSQVGIDA